jgi:hypothetical protein
MTQLLSLFNQVFGIHPKSKDLETFSYSNSYIAAIKQSLNDLLEAWIEARSEQSKYYNKHCHIE